MLDKPCEKAEANPVCPYITEIHQQGKDIKMIKAALIGEDMQSGMVAEIHRFKILWNILIFISGATITGLIALTVKLLH